MPKMITKIAIGFIVLIFAGCASSKNSTKAAPKANSGLTTRAYVADKERVDQEMQGNYGYLQGNAVAPDRSALKKTRKVYVLEVTKENAENVTTKTASNVTEGSTLPADLREERAAPAPTRRKVVIPRIDDEPAARAEKAESADASGSEQTYTIDKNDTLQKISKKFYGSFAKWNKIYEANKDVIKDPNRIKAGTVIKIPVLD